MSSNPLTQIQNCASPAAARQIMADEGVNFLFKGADVLPIYDQAQLILFMWRRLKVGGRTKRTSCPS